ncbi:MAG: hypothetical protein EX254_09175, partial [Flavobacteriaceae bacterium]
MRSIKLITVLLFLLFCSYGSAQDTLYVDPVKIDSLASLLTEPDIEDIEKVKLLNEYARLNFYNRKLIQGFTATIEAVNISEKIGYKEGEVLYHKTLAAFLGDSDMVPYHYQKARMLLTQLNKGDSFEEVQVPTGYPDPINERYHQILINAIEHFKDAERKDILATLYNHLGAYYFMNNNLDNLNITIERTIKIYEELGELYPI